MPIEIPYSRGFKANNDETILPEAISSRDVLLHAMLARVAHDGEVQEFATSYNQTTNTVELMVPDGCIDFVADIDIGPRLQRYMDWLSGNRSSTTIFPPSDENPEGMKLGDLYYNTVLEEFMIYNSTLWVSVATTTITT